MSKTLMGDEATPVTLEQYFGLILAGIGMWVYNLVDEDEAHWSRYRSTVGAGVEVDGDDRDSIVIGPARASMDVSFASDRTSSFGRMWARRNLSAARRSVSTRSASFNTRGVGLGAGAPITGRGKEGRVDFTSPGVGENHHTRWSSAASLPA